MTRSIALGLALAAAGFACSGGSEDENKDTSNASALSAAPADPQRMVIITMFPRRDAGSPEASTTDASTAEASTADATPTLPKQCMGSETCAAGEQCSTVRGVCLTAAGSESGGAGIGGSAVCLGYCEAKPTTPPCTGKGQCGAGQHCSTERGECLKILTSTLTGADCYGKCEQDCSQSSQCPYGNRCVTTCNGAPPPESYTPLPNHCEPATVCFSNADCTSGQTCSTEQGDCRYPSGGATPGVCSGVCEETSIQLICQ